MGMRKTSGGKDGMGAAGRRRARRLLAGASAGALLVLAVVLLVVGGLPGAGGPVGQGGPLGAGGVSDPQRSQTPATGPDTRQAGQAGVFDHLGTDDIPEVDPALEGEGYARGEALVVFSQGTTAQEAEALLAGMGMSADHAELAEAIEGRSIATVQVPAGMPVTDALERLAASGVVSYAQPNYIYTTMEVKSEPESELEADAAASLATTSLVPQATSIDDPRAPEQWQLAGIGAYGAWDAVKAEGSVAVAVIDSGVDDDHEDLAGRLVAGRNVVDDNDDYDDIFGHGTHVAGIIAATSNNGIGVSGVSYNANIIPVMAGFLSGDNCGFYDSDLIGAYEYLLADADEDGQSDLQEQYGLHVVNMSLGGFGSCQAGDSALFAYIDAAYDQDILTVCAAGNDSKQNKGAADTTFPADYETCVSVIALDRDGTRAYYSNYGDAKDISAPGTDILSTTFDGGYGTKRGTSMASPVVAGAASLLFAQDATLTCDGAKQRLYSTAEDLGDEGYDPFFGWGKLDALAAVGVAAKPVTVTISGGEHARISDGDAVQPSFEVEVPFGGKLAKAYTVVPDEGWEFDYFLVGESTELVDLSSCRFTTATSFTAVCLEDDGAVTSMTLVMSDEASLQPTLYFKNADGIITVDWGDGTTSASAQGGDVAVAKEAPYEQAGTYEVKVTSTGSYTLGAGWLEGRRMSLLGDVTYAPCLKRITLAANAAVGSCSFLDCTNLLRANLEACDTSQVTDMSHMFYNCSSLASLDLSSFDTSSVTNMGGMFYGCSSLASVDLSGLDTSSVRDMSYMFSDCSSLSALDLSSFDTSNVEDMSRMFYSFQTESLTVSPGFFASGEPAFPDPTGSVESGRWFSQAEKAWFTPAEILASRRDVADVYTIDGAAIEPSAPTITTASLHDGTVGMPYHRALAADGYPRDIVWSLEDGSALPSGLSLSEEGVICGTPTQAGAYTFSVRAANGHGAGVAKEYTLTVGKRQIAIPKAAGGLVYTASSQEGVAAGEGFTVAGGSAVDAGSHVATASLIDPDNSCWKDGGVADRQIEWSVAPATLTVTPDTLSKTYGQSDPELTYTVSGAIGSETPAFTGTLARAAGEDVGSYAVTLGTLALAGDAASGFLASNYALSFAGGVSFSIGKATLAVTPDALSKTYGQTDPPLTFTASGVIGDETPAFSGTLSREAGEDVGSYAVTLGTLAPKDGVKNGFKASNYVLALAGNVTFNIVKEEATKATLERIAGAAAADTSAAISAETFPDGSGWVVLARDDDFADAMSATGLAGALDAPIVLTGRTGLGKAAKAEIARLGAKRCYVIGGRGAMPGDFEKELAALGLEKVERVFGAESWDTSVACAAKIAAHGGNARGEAIVAMSSNFQDALSISSFAYRYGVPIYLETSGAAGRALPKAAIKNIKALSGTIYVPGGTGAVPASTVEGVFGKGRVVRLSGHDGYDTSNQIAAYMAGKGLLSAGAACVACGAQAARGTDALSGAALAGRAGGVMLLVNSNAAMEPKRLATVEGKDSEGTPAFLAKNASSITDAYILGGTYVVPKALEVKIRSILGA